MIEQFQFLKRGVDFERWYRRTQEDHAAREAASQVNPPTRTGWLCANADVVNGIMAAHRTAARRIFDIYLSNNDCYTAVA